MAEFSRDKRSGFRRGNRAGGNRFSGISSGRSLEARDSDNSSGRRFRGNSGFGRRDGRDLNRKPLEMHDAICAKCGKQCQVPFKPSGDKPVLCSDCFRGSEGSSRSFPRSRDRPSQSGISSEQFNKINEKIDKIMKALKIK